MIRLFHAYFPARTLLLASCEALLITLTFFVAVVLRFGHDADLILLYENGLPKIVAVTVVFLLSMYYLDMYEPTVLNNRHELLNSLIRVFGIAILIMALMYYAYPRVRLGRSVFLIGLLLLLPVLVLWRKVSLKLITALPLAQRTLIVGNGEMTECLAKQMIWRPELGMKLVGYLDVAESTAGNAPVAYLGGLDRLDSVVRHHKIDQIVVTLQNRRDTLPVEHLLALKHTGIQVQDGIDLYESVTGKVCLASLRLSWLLFSRGFHVSRPMLLWKRMLSVALSLPALLLASPIMLLVAIAIRLDSPGPVIFRQERVGKDGKTFNLYKFRSMHDRVDREGDYRPAQADDARITRVGKIIRRCRLDELPQLYNVLRGDMYFVGPRPFVPNQERELAAKIPFYGYRWAVKPGATGWAQVNHGYCSTIEDNRTKLEYDLFYIKNLSVGLDFLILLRTIKILLLGRGGR